MREGVGERKTDDGGQWRTREGGAGDRVLRRAQAGAQPRGGGGGTLPAAGRLRVPSG